MVTGGTGYVGQAVQEALLAEGHEVKVLARRGPVQEGVRLVPGDIRTMDLTDPVEGADAVVHLVGIIRPRVAEGVTFAKMHPEVTERVIRTMATTGITRLIHMSALGTRPRARSLYHRSKWMSEELVRGSFPIDYTILRPSLMFGGGAPFFQMLADGARMPLTPVPGDGQTVFQPVYRGDVARLIVRCLDNPDQSVGKTFEVGGPQRFTLNQLYDRVGKSLGRPHLAKIHLPTGLLSGMARLGENIPWFPVTADQLQMLQEPNFTDDDAWLELAGPATAMGNDF